MEAKLIIKIHEFLVNYFKDQDDPITPPGVKNMTSLESAAARPFTTISGQDAYPDIFHKSAALFHSIVGNHPFHNGNKRVALLSTLYLLSEHGYWIDSCTDDEMYEFTRKIAAHEICVDRKDEIATIASWISRNSRKRMKGEKPLKFIALVQILARFGYRVEEDGANCSIYNHETDEFVTSILKKGTHGVEDFDPQYISRLRKILNLTTENGIDSSLFYGRKELNEDLGEFVKLRIEVMKQLART